MCDKHPELEGARNARNHRCLGCERERDQRRYRRKHPDAGTHASPSGTVPWYKSENGRAYRARWLKTPAGVAYLKRKRDLENERQRRGREKGRGIIAREKLRADRNDLFKGMRVKRERW